MRFHPRYGVLCVAAIAVLAFTLALPTGWTGFSPLPWDEAGHFLGASQFRDGLVNGDVHELGRSLLGADQYPPGHSVALGIWMAIFGDHVASWLSFALVVYVLTAVMLARLHPAAGLLFIGLGMFGGLAPSLMVEPLAVLWVVMALTLIPDALDGGRDRLLFAASWLAAYFALMTKYNFGLPLVAALVIAGVVRWNRRSILASVIAGVAVIGSWALFLTLQDKGWEMFRAFAQNRANSVEASPIDRLDWYLTSFRHQWLASAWLGLGLLSVLVAGIASGIRNGPRPGFVAAIALAGGTLTSIALHPYLLGRNLVIVVVAVAVALGLGLRSVGWRSRMIPLHAAAVLAALLAIPSSNAHRCKLVEAYYPSAAWELQAISDEVDAALNDGGLVRVVGTFNEFSAGWARLLQRRSPVGTSLAIDVPYPLERSRERLDADWDPEYARIIESWTTDGTRKVVGIEVAPDSRFMNEGYERWSLWKQNLVRALDESAGFARVSVDSLDAGVHVLVYESQPAGGVRDESRVVMP